MKATDIPGLGNLSVPEKIRLVEDLWEIVRQDESDIPVPESHLQELERRLERHRREPGNLLTLEELKARIEKDR